MPKYHPAPIIAHPTQWQDVILVCRKCSKKLGGGFGPTGDDTLIRELKRSLRSSGHRSTARVMETKCLGICPKNAVTVLQASHPAAILSVPAGTPTSALLPKLLPPPPAPQLPRTAAPTAGS